MKTRSADILPYFKRRGKIERKLCPFWRDGFNSRQPKDFELEVLYETETEYKCNCSAEKTLSVLRSFDIKELFPEGENKNTVEAKCNFCEKKYIFSKEEIKKR